ncbi:RNA polymerase sigma factor [Roseibium aestuarii]|uniref:RNA polymerase sigma factor n=1 Tax=Roseibium aestuarii TaxID=2600299 RepID=A0ABW4K0Q9_9HYPH|nr:RNA polymerase sigma factor [Roseibium aestuarii]
MKDAIVLRRRALRLTRGNRDEADDLLSSTLIKAVTHVERHGTDVLEPRAFLLFAMRNEHISRIRRQVPERSLRDMQGDVHQDEYYGLAEAAPDQENCLRHQDALRRVLSVVDALPEELRAVFSLRFLDECSYRDIARQLEITETLARKRIQHLREKLRAALGEDLDFGSEPGPVSSQSLG